jgi:predicted phosphodiesterase
MRVAVLSDIHGNLPALEAVLAAIERERVDRIVLTGDIASGPLPAETLDTLATLGDRAIWVHGNGERALVEAFDGRSNPTDADAAAARLLTRAHRDRIAGLPLMVTLDVDGLGPTLFCHATPRRDDEFVLVDSPPERWAAVLDGVPERVIVLGHTHMPFVRLVDTRWAVNPGSVGMAYGHPGASWALLGPAIELRRTLYDAEAAAARIRRSAVPGAAEWANTYVLRQHTDIEALNAFTPLARDGPLP